MNQVGWVKFEVKGKAALGFGTLIGMWLDQEMRPKITFIWLPPLEMF